jgi:hypothetical protein
VVYKQGTEENVRQDIPDGTTFLYEAATNDVLDSVTLYFITDNIHFQYDYYAEQNPIPHNHHPRIHLTLAMNTLIIKNIMTNPIQSSKIFLQLHQSFVSD